MRIRTLKHAKTKTIAGDFGTITAGMDMASLPFILEMLSKNFYSNPIGSIVREITSNCFDSHIEAKVTEPVIIKITEDDEGMESIVFKDVGAGLSPSRIKNIYMNWFTSTKRGTNAQIGGFGLGSKTPLAYQDQFYITTVHGKVKYEYLFSKGKTLPVLDLLNEEKTTEHNGTEIRIEIKDWRDKNAFIRELRHQLCYFDNVFFENCDIDNEYIIHENSLFKFRNKDTYSDEMHIAFGKVSYPIDWEMVELNRCYAPVGVKFEIGELEVTPNREAIRYTEKTKKIIKERVTQSIDKLKEIYLSQQHETDDLFEWWEVKDKHKFIKIGEDKLYLKEFKFAGLKSQLKIVNELGISEKVFDKRILDTMYMAKSELQGGKIVNRKLRNDTVTSRFSNNPDYLLFNSGGGYTNLENHINRRGIIIQRRTVKDSRSYLDSSLNFNINYGDYFNVGAGMKIYKVRKYIQQQVESKIRPYHREPTEVEVEDFKEFKATEDRTSMRGVEVTITDVIRNSKGTWGVAEIESFTGQVIYGFGEDKRALERAEELMALRPTFNTNAGVTYSNRSWNRKALKIIIIAKSNERYFKRRKNMMKIDKLYGDNRLFRQIATSYKIEEVLGAYAGAGKAKSARFKEFLMGVNSSVGTTFSELLEYRNKYSGGNDTSGSELKNSVLEVANQFNLFDLEMLAKIKVVDDYFKGAEIIKYLDLNTTTLPIIVKYLKEHKKRVNMEYYYKIVAPEKFAVQLELELV